MICDGVLCDGCLWKNGLHRVTNGSLCFADNPKFLIADSGDDDNVKAGLARLVARLRIHLVKLHISLMIVILIFLFLIFLIFLILL